MRWQPAQSCLEVLVLFCSSSSSFHSAYFCFCLCFCKHVDLSSFYFRVYWSWSWGYHSYPIDIFLKLSEQTFIRIWMALRGSISVLVTHLMSFFYIRILFVCLFVCPPPQLTIGPFFRSVCYSSASILSENSFFIPIPDSVTHSLYVSRGGHWTCMYIPIFFFVHCYWENNQFKL